MKFTTKIVLYDLSSQIENIVLLISTNRNHLLPQTALNLGPFSVYVNSKKGEIPTAKGGGDFKSDYLKR